MKRAFAFVLLLSASAPLAAQNFQTGIVAFGAYDSQGFTSVNLANGNLVLTIPLISYPQKGTLPNVGYSLVSNSPDWLQTCSTDDEGNTYCSWDLDSFARFGPKTAPNNELWKTTCPGCDPLGIWQTVADSTGAKHTEAPFDSTYVNYFAMDASGYKLSFAGGTITEIDPHGVSHNGATWVDPSGNTVTVTSGGYAGTSGYTDSFGRSIPAPPGTCALVGICGSYPSGCYENGYPAVSGGTAGFTFCFETITYSPAIGTADNPDEDCTVTNPGSAETNVLQSITLPNGASWQFGYDSNGDIQTITTPAGGTVTLAWEPLPGGTQCGYDGEVFSRWVQSRTVNAVPGNPSYAKTWNYSYNASFSPATVTDPDGNYTVHTFYGSFEGEVQYYDHTGALLKTDNTGYFMDLVPELTSTTWPNGQVSAICTIYDQNANTSCTPGDDAYSSSTQYFYYPYSYIHFPIVYGSLNYKYEYDYGSGSYGSALRKTVTQYQWQSNTSYQTANILDIPASVQVLNGGGSQFGYTTYGYDESGSPSCVCGNQTSIHRWLNTTSGYLVTNNVYDSNGRMTSTTDPKTNATTFGYGSGYAGTGPTSVTNALGQSTNYAYDFNTGLLTSTTDPNSQTTSYSYDSSRRLTSIAYPDGGQVGYSYTDSAPPSFVFTQKITSGSNFTEEGLMDGFGRLTQSQVQSDPEGVDYTDTTYDDLGRVATVSNPYRSSGEISDGSTSYQYDPLNRVTGIIEQDGSPISYSYSGACTTTTDEAGHTRKICNDGLGRLASVVENPGGLNYTTSYTHDPLDNLTSAEEVTQIRIFYYNSLSWLTRAGNPETGYVNYTYDADGNVITKTDGRGIVTCYGNWSTSCDGTGYDALNRVTHKSYSDGTPSAFIVYDGTGWWGITQQNVVGRVMEEWTGTSCCATGGAEIFSYDPMGRVILNDQYTPAMGNNIPTYTYDLAGDTTSASNGVGVTISYGYDGAMRPTSVTSSLVDSSHPATLWTSDASQGYYPPGNLRKATFGNGVTEANLIEPRLQPCRIDFNSSGGVPSACDDTLTSGNIQHFHYNYGNWGSTNNGDVTEWIASGAQNFDRSYTYDSLNRLQSMSAPGDTCSGLSWTIDPLGNRNVQAATGGTCNTFNQTANSANQLPASAGYRYDGAGNMTADGHHAYFYDAENRLIQVDGTPGTCSTATACYLYDAFGHRVEKQIGSAYVSYLHDIDGNAVAEWCNSCGSFTGWSRGYVYLGGQQIAEYGDATTYFVQPDHLGSARLLTNISGCVVDNLDYLPYGELISQSGVCSAADTAHKFTGKERDAESGLDNFGARYLGSSLGRFMSPDSSDNPDAVPYADLQNPQSLNLYAYVQNNPLANIDPDGHNCFNSDDTSYGKDAQGNLVVSDTCDPWSDVWNLVDNNVLSPAVNMAEQMAQQTADILRRPNGLGCLAATTGSGLIAGGTTGGEVGLVGLAGGGVSVVVTEPAGLLIGGAGGAATGFTAGLAICSSGTGGGGSSGGSSGSKGNQLSNAARRKLGNLANRAGETIRDVIRSRGGTASNVNQAGQWANRTLGEAAEAAARGDASAETAIKIAKQASRLGQQY